MNIDETKQNICNYLKDGMLKKDAATFAGISEATLYRWMGEDESFKSQVEWNVLAYKRSLIKNMSICAEKDGRLALEVLRRRYPNEWGINTRIEVREESVSTTKQVAYMLQQLLNGNVSETTSR